MMKGFQATFTVYLFFMLSFIILLLPCLARGVQLKVGEVVDIPGHDRFSSPQEAGEVIYTRDTTFVAHNSDGVPVMTGKLFNAVVRSKRSSGLLFFYRFHNLYAPTGRNKLYLKTFMHIPGFGLFPTNISYLEDGPGDVFPVGAILKQNGMLNISFPLEYLNHGKSSKFIVLSTGAPGFNVHYAGDVMVELYQDITPSHQSPIFYPKIEFLAVPRGPLKIKRQPSPTMKPLP